ncbi:hypothetical protein DFH27DRAFT_551656 [Peziza echinospora]|nr:hypothetical protein DFH27DRAFT_551656 [Peziza echinospora]
MSLQFARAVRQSSRSTCLQQIGNSSQQVRGAKKLARSTTITVALLQDVPKFGRKGSILAVARGRMRNLWFPRGMAQYLPRDEQKHLKKEGIVMFERDVTFRPDLELNKKVKAAEVEVLPDTEALVALNIFLPPNLQFARSTIDTTNAIHGSIAPADIAAIIRAMAASSEGDVSKVVISPENIVFTNPLEGDKIRHLGTYPFEIRLKGTEESVKRNVVVTKQAADGNGKA